jgi:hypothetical protein
MERILGNLADDEEEEVEHDDESIEELSNHNGSSSSAASAPSPPKKKKTSKKSNNADVALDKTTMSQINKKNAANLKKSQVTPSTTAETTAGAMTEQKQDNCNNKELIEPSSLSTGMRTRYIGDMSPLPFLAQKINFEDARIASKIGIKIRRFGQSLVLYEKDERLNDKSANQVLLEDLNMLKPGETIKGLNDWIYKVAGVDKSTSDSLMKV